MLFRPLVTKTHRNLTDVALGDVRLELLKTIPADDKIVFSPKNPKYTVTVFTDTGCQYCHLVQQNLQGYMDAGIRIEYVPFPRGGNTSPEMAVMKSVWCAKDPKAAYNAVVVGGQKLPADRKRVGKGTCVYVSVDLGGRRIIKKKHTQ